MAKPLLAPETIYETALQLLDEEGAEALSARNLAARLQCSTRTLYQQVGKREELITRLLEHHLAGLRLEFQEGETWQDSAMAWAHAIRGALLAHPNLSRLMTIEHRGPIASYVNALLKILLRAGFDEELALRSCRVLVNVAISLSLAEAKSPQRPARARRSRDEIRFEDLVIERSGGDPDNFQEPPAVFENAIRWLVLGLEREASAAPTSR